MNKWNEVFDCPKQDHSGDKKTRSFEGSFFQVTEICYDFIHMIIN
jgi:hypothetical protein